MFVLGLQCYISIVFFVVEIFFKVEVGQMGQKYSFEVVNIVEIVVLGGLIEEKRQEIIKNLMEKYILECVQLENEFCLNEIKIIFEVIMVYEEKKGKVVVDLWVRICGYISYIIWYFCYINLVYIDYNFQDRIKIWFQIFVIVKNC